MADDGDDVDRLGEQLQAVGAQVLTQLSGFAPPTVMAQASRLMARQRMFNLVVTNVPGPQFPLYLGGAELQANYPVSVITHGMGLNITVMSYRGHLDFGILADRDQMPDVWKLIGWLGEGLEELEP